MISNPIFSCIIPTSAKDAESQNLKDLISSIKAQDFPQDQIEILVMGEEYGDSEQAKGIGIKRAKGEICAMFCADNYLIDKRVFSAIGRVFQIMPNLTGAYTKFYYYKNNDNSLNRYFSLIGNNDPIAFYLGKSDRKPYYECDQSVASQMFFSEKDILPSLGDNGFFFKRDHLLKADIDHYYPMDVCKDLAKKGYGFYHQAVIAEPWHRTADNLISFLTKRYKYAKDLYCERTDRRWKIIDTNRDKWLLIWFVASVILVIPCLLISLKGFLKIRDYAWWLHWPVCFGFLITYTLLALRNFIKHGNLFQIKCPKPA